MTTDVNWSGISVGGIVVLVLLIVGGLYVSVEMRLNKTSSIPSKAAATEHDRLPALPQRDDHQRQRPGPRRAASDGLGKWSEADLTKGFHTCEGPFMPLHDLRGMSNDELKAMWRYLMSLSVGNTAKR